MTVEFENRENVKSRVRKRRRAIGKIRYDRRPKALKGPFLVIAICMIAGIAGYIGAQGGGTGDTGLAYSVHADEAVVYDNVVVKSGDTLWGIASGYTDPSKDIRKTISEICAVNDIKAGAIYPGQVIKVPVPASRVQAD